LNENDPPNLKFWLRLGTRLCWQVIGGADVTQYWDSRTRTKTDVPSARKWQDKDSDINAAALND
jgi:hypothetical protein